MTTLLEAVSERRLHPQALWTTFKRLTPKTVSERNRHPADDARSYVTETSWFENSRYTVGVHGVPSGDRCPALWHLVIQRHDLQPPGAERYRDFMRIRDELIGAEHEALEMYPARSREVDTGNIYHLWVLQSASEAFPIGFK